VPSHLLPSLLAKLSADVLDAGSFLSFAPRPPNSPLLPRSRYTLHACVPLSPASHVFLVDQHFQFSFSELPRILKAYPGLAEQLGEALECELAEVPNAVWSHCHALPLAASSGAGGADSYSQFFLPDPVGLSLSHSRAPNCAVSTLAYRGAPMVALYPLRAVPVGEACTIDYLASAAPPTQVLPFPTWRSAAAAARELHRPLRASWSAESLRARFPAFAASLPPASPPRVPWGTLLAAFPFSEPLPAASRARATLPEGAACKLPPAKGADFLREPLPSLPVYVDRAKMSGGDLAKFNEFYQGRNLPVLLAGVPAAEGWGCVGGAGAGGESGWSFAKLRADESLCRTPMKCGEDERCRPVEMPLGQFLEYLEGNEDDAPLYVFDSSSIKESSVRSGDNVVSRGCVREPLGGEGARRSGEKAAAAEVGCFARGLLGGDPWGGKTCGRRGRA
jgi:hypothetical protein